MSKKDLYDSIFEAIYQPIAMLEVDGPKGVSPDDFIANVTNIVLDCIEKSGHDQKNIQRKMLILKKINESVMREHAYEIFDEKGGPSSAAEKIAFRFFTADGTI